MVYFHHCNNDFNCWYTIMWDSWWCWLASREVTENWSMSRGWRTRGHEDRPIHGAGPGPGLTGGTGCTSLPLDCPRNLPQSLLSISNPSQLKIIAEFSQLQSLGIYLWYSNWCTRVQLIQIQFFLIGLPSLLFFTFPDWPTERPIVKPWPQTLSPKTQNQGALGWH